MTPASPRTRLVLIHLAVWVIYIFYEVLLLILSDATRFNYWETILNFGLYAGLFYGNSHLLLPRLYRTRNYLAFGAGLVLLLTVYAGLRYLLNVHLLPALPMPMMRPVTSLNIMWAQSMYRGLYFLMLSFAYWFARNAILLEKAKREQEARLRTTEKSLLEAEVAFLRSQINPHFLFNALNFLYSQVYPLSESSAKGILLLSQIMRYALKEANENGKVMLEDEVHHLQNYIAMNQLRFSNKLQIQFEVSGNFHFLMILPLVLITFVENCFKHGELSDPDNPLIIRLKTTDNQLYFYTHNRKRDGPKEQSTGIGLANTRKRLDVIYPERYTLHIDNAPDHYTCTLILTL